MTTETAPVMGDQYFDDYFEALRESIRRQEVLRECHFVSRVEEAPYGKRYRVRSMPVEMVFPLNPYDRARIASPFRRRRRGL